MNTNQNGPMNRVDGRLKVTGGARYAAEFPLQNMAHAVIIQSTIARGQIKNIDTSIAEKAPGVLAIITHLNAPKVVQTAGSQTSGDAAPEGGDEFSKPVAVLKDANIDYYGQHIGVVIAETFEQAKHATELVKVTYNQERPAIILNKNLNRAYKPDKLAIPLKPDSGRGDINKGLSNAQVKLDETYSTPIEHHNPMESSATIAVWQGKNLTLYDASQNVNGVQDSIANTLRINKANVQVISHFLGGGFGCKFPVRGHIVLAAISAQRVQRPVKLVLTRQQMFTSVGCRPHSLQRIRLGALPNGKLTAVAQEITTQTSIAKEFVEHIGAATNMMYNAPNVLVTHRAVPLNMVTPTIMRAPGETPGMFALESALDELAYKLNIDPVELRIINDPPQDPEKNLPWSSRSLVQCLRQGAERFGWNKRNSKPASMRDGRYLIGYGVASATYPTNRQAASALAKILSNGQVLIQIAATDLGTGTYTILTQVAAEALGVAPEKVRVEIGDTRFPKSPGSGGSWGAASYGSAVYEACMAVRSKVASLNPSQGESYEQTLAKNKLKEISAQVESKSEGAEKKYSMHAFGAQFAEVRVDRDLGMVQVARFLGVFGAGRILNPKTAKSQMIGGIVWGISQALHEETHIDERYGNFVNNNLGEYHVPVNADIPDIDVLFLDEKDNYVNPLGVKGVGEIGIVGAGAAVANAIYNATGKRIRDLPITPDKLL
jgi:xanthine dehydrogenase YagR molybdenum-binding subunit